MINVNFVAVHTQLPREMTKKGNGKAINFALSVELAFF